MRSIGVDASFLLMTIKNAIQRFQLKKRPYNERLKYRTIRMGKSWELLHNEISRFN